MLTQLEVNNPHTVAAPSRLRSAVPRRLLRVQNGGGVLRAGFHTWKHPVVGRARGAKRLGIIYERRCQEELSARFGDAYVASPFLCYTLRDGAAHTCVPDGLLFDWKRREIIIVEMKLRYTYHAEIQLEQLYAPIVRKMFPGFKIRFLVVCKFYDPSATSLRTVVPTTLDVFLPERHFQYGVVRWKL